VLALSSDRVIDACVHRLPNGRWRMWYKDERHGQHTYAADSHDLFHWGVVGPVITDNEHEGPNVFQWRGAYWMVTDPWKGLALYRSEDAESWSYQGFVLDTPSGRREDGPRGHHADVLVIEDEAYIFYHTHPGALGMEQGPDLDFARRRSSLHCARLVVDDTKRTKLACCRDGFPVGPAGWDGPCTRVPRLPRRREVMANNCAPLTVPAVQVRSPVKSPTRCRWHLASRRVDLMPAWEAGVEHVNVQMAAKARCGDHCRHISCCCQSHTAINS